MLIGSLALSHADVPIGWDSI